MYFRDFSVDILLSCKVCLIGWAVHPQVQDKVSDATKTIYGPSSQEKLFINIKSSLLIDTKTLIFPSYC